MKLVWDREDDERRRRRAALIAAEIEQASKQQEREDREAEIEREREAEVERRRNYYLTAHKSEGNAMEKLVAKLQDELEGNWRTKALVKLEKLTAEIRHDRLKAEREALTRRGVLRGRR
jgi:hypothetical protein